jgi:carbon-monoxide dehydrogenase medium subunit
VLAGGQSLLASLNLRLSSPELLVDVTGLKELSGIRVQHDALRIGALTRHCEIERSAKVAQHVPLLAQAAPHVAHVAIRNAGTLGGSLALADPAAEYPACALALEAMLVIAGPRGERRVAARDFFRGLYSTALEPQELLVAAEFPLLEPGYRSAFLELARRHGDYAIIGVAAHARVEGGRLSDLRLAYLGAGATAVRAERAAAAVEGKAYGPHTVAAAQAALGEDLEPPPDLYHSAATKLHLARVLTGRALAALVQ